MRWKSLVRCPGHISNTRRMEIRATAHRSCGQSSSLRWCHLPHRTHIHLHTRTSRKTVFLLYRICSKGWYLKTFRKLIWWPRTAVYGVRAKANLPKPKPSVQVFPSSFRRKRREFSCLERFSSFLEKSWKEASTDERDEKETRLIFESDERMFMSSFFNMVIQMRTAKAF